MPFNPRYTITERLLANIKQITSIVAELNNRHFPNIILLEFEKTAREVSAYSSTSIEGNPLPLTEVKKILKTTPSHIRDSEKEVLNYNRALQELNQQLTEGKVEFSIDHILNIQKQVMEGLLPKFEIGLRQKPVVVNDPRTGQVVYLPPDVQDVMPMLKELTRYVTVNSMSIDPLILAGIFHKQMVIIHPFMDGNGRTTRLMTKVLLAKMGLNTFNLFSFENYYNQNVAKYFQTVGEFGNYYDLVEKMDFTKWLEYFTEGIIDELLRVQKLMPETSTESVTRLEDYHIKILDFIKENGSITHREYAKLVSRAKPTRVLDFQKLIDAGFIDKKGQGRATYYVLSEK